MKSRWECIENGVWEGHFPGGRIYTVWRWKGHPGVEDDLNERTKEQVIWYIAEPGSDVRAEDDWADTLEAAKRKIKQRERRRFRTGGLS